MVSSKILSMLPCLQGGVAHLLGEVAHLEDGALHIEGVDHLDMQTGTIVDRESSHLVS